MVVSKGNIQIPNRMSFIFSEYLIKNRPFIKKIWPN